MSKNATQLYDTIVPSYVRLMDRGFINDFISQRFPECFSIHFGYAAKGIDPGFGTGTDAIYLSQRGINMYGLALSTGMIEASIRSTKEFVVNFVGAAVENKNILYRKVTGKVAKKFSLAALPCKEAQNVNVPILRDALSFLECKDVETYPLDDHTLFAGKGVREELIENKMTSELYSINKSL